MKTLINFFFPYHYENKTLTQNNVELMKNNVELMKKLEILKDQDRMGPWSTDTAVKYYGLKLN
jgi:hypothetical protein